MISQAGRTSVARSDFVAMRARKILLILATCGAAILGHKVTDAQNQQGFTVTGAITHSWIDPKGNRHETGYPGPLTTRLCSVDRVFETQPDHFGTITFLNVPPGIYELSAGRQVVPPRTIKGIEVKAEEVKPAPLRMDIEDPRIMKIEDADCFRDSIADCALTSLRIEYGQPLGQGSALISGRVAEWNHERSRGLGKAKISLTKTGDPGVHYSAVSDKNGLFQFAPLAGVYDLTASVAGFQDVKINGFLVPRENDTKVTLLTQNKNTIIACQ
jgi:Carboxypeptidase regulatory-like domain